MFLDQHPCEFESSRPYSLSGKYPVVLELPNLADNCFRSVTMFRSNGLFLAIFMQLISPTDFE